MPLPLMKSQKQISCLPCSPSQPWKIPNSVQQLKTWLSENGLEAESLGKKDVCKAHPEHRWGYPAGIETPPADSKIFCKEIPGNGKCSLQGRTCPRNVSVLRSQLLRTLGGQTDPAAEPPPQNHMEDLAEARELDCGPAAMT